MGKILLFGEMKYRCICCNKAQYRDVGPFKIWDASECDGTQVRICNQCNGAIEKNGYPDVISFRRYYY
jgi:hypothetical protein